MPRRSHSRAEVRKQVAVDGTLYNGRQSAVMPSPVEASRARDELERVLAGPAFGASERLKRFLRFVVEEALAGRGDRLKEYTIGVEVFDKRDAFDPRTDSSVRSEASKLRLKLRLHYETDGRDAALRIELPKGSYVPEFTARESGPASSPAAPAGRWLVRPGWWGIVGVATLGVLAAFGTWLWTSRSPGNPAAVTRFTLNLGNETLATDLQGPHRVLAISRDGSTLAYIVREAEMRRLYLRPMSSFAGRAVPGTEGASAPFFSPDGAWVGFGAKGKLYKLPVAGGPPLELCDAAFLGGSWDEDGKIVFADGVGLHRVSAAGGPSIAVGIDPARQECSRTEANRAI